MQKSQKKWIQYIIMLLILVAIGFILYVSVAKDGEKVVKVGDKAPLFELKNLEGEKVALSDYKGKGVILNFWGTWCNPCKEEMPDLNRMNKIYHSKGVEVLTVHVKDSPQQVKQFFSELPEEVELMVALDGSGDVMRAYNANDLPNTYVIDKNGIIKAHHKGQMSRADIKKYMDMVQP
ncbi:thiol-disulfide oxidoreductase ResA [Macrococcoides caseolyticum]|uniref:thiol-disulfide oxidoreductase ResA n=1 Tax=Macrococcoides caseolyticum TaxID=69966 RepID=UPI000C156004|nr:thiol-disulfide oxidoreductase ResA [Macrococcus caseolyticus]MBQ5151806.1 thiol-disulfide oxidoreductase ResA [Macrococcus caseolyticus]MDJ1088334.1 thiol-disulfide oxidoreductase ResA [Macrococcus caseolyticus]MDJ1091017.1 thiol-disulfide oxidoreductase ResA [Macrococcus caseolyticus]MDJ1153629.1 thiol-disulfide oxidoreductase ResA [Macrococcus caseolyticus]PKE34437.1 cytochrome c biogenesis protein ResA [Macrococcus caseolyticus]